MLLLDPADIRAADPGVSACPAAAAGADAAAAIASLVLLQCLSCLHYLELGVDVSPIVEVDQHSLFEVVAHCAAAAACSSFSHPERYMLAAGLHSCTQSILASFLIRRYP
jgi:hypothetical protein